MILEEAFKLNNGVKIPKLGLGTWFIDDKALMAIEHSDYGQAAVFPVYGGKLR